MLRVMSVCLFAIGCRAGAARARALAAPRAAAFSRGLRAAGGAVADGPPVLTLEAASTIVARRRGTTASTRVEEVASTQVNAALAEASAKEFKDISAVVVDAAGRLLVRDDVEIIFAQISMHRKR